MANCYIVYVLLLVVTTVVVDGSRRVIRRAGDQPGEGKCMEFKWGGNSHVHWYTCCNNCQNSKPGSCDGITWQSASSTSYCGSCGVDTKKGNGKRRKGEFSCGGCDGQQRIRSKCKSWWKKIPGFCWAFSKCFHTQCTRSYSFVSNTCGNGICDSGETSSSCPIDCCHTQNPKCAWNTTCVPECCGEDGCCLTSAGYKTLAPPNTILTFTVFVLCVYNMSIA